MIFMLTFTLDRVLAVKGRTSSEKWLNIIGICFIVLCIAATASLGGFSACNQRVNAQNLQYDYGCLCFNNSSWSFIIWFSLFGVAGIATLVLIVKISYSKCMGRYNGLNEEFKLAFVIYKIPPLMFAIYAIQLVIQAFQALIPTNTWEKFSSFVTSILFLAPIVSLIAAIVYRRKFLKLQPHLSDIHFLGKDDENKASHLN